ncbi:MAG: hypothetical protein JWO51_2021 [Rhodospirillales bacterium]|nr:hypothetical protein [Rhodospirillales bacterium]
MKSFTLYLAALLGMILVSASLSACSDIHPTQTADSSVYADRPFPR